ncbi:MAG: cytochrome c biogenesis CcdA family protein [Nitriliruptorales bacterium]
MIEAPLALAFTAGLVATVNPCGFAMLPAYLSYFVGLEDDTVTRGSAASLSRALVVGGVVSAGFLLVFGVIGVLVTLGLRSVIDLIPWAAIVIGVGVGLLGIAMLAGYEPVTSLPKLSRGTEGRGHSAVFLFGVSYAVASLSCTLPIFLSVVAGTVPQTDLVSGVATFLVYGLGMSLVLLAVTVALALGKRSIVGWLRRSSRHVNRVAGAILVAAGGYIVYFWATNLGRSPVRASDPVAFVEGLSSRATRLIGDAPVTSGAVLGAIVLAAVVFVLLAHARGEPP